MTLAAKEVNDKLPPCPSCGGNDVDLSSGHYTGDSNGLFYAAISCHTQGCKADASVLGDTETKAIEKILKVWRRETESKPESSKTGIGSRYDISKQIPDLTPEQIKGLKADTTKAPLPCPNPVCQNPTPVMSTKRWPNNTKDYHVRCNVCQMRGPTTETDWNAIRLWNMIKRAGQPESASLEAWHKLQDTELLDYFCVFHNEGNATPIALFDRMQFLNDFIEPLRGGVDLREHHRKNDIMTLDGWLTGEPESPPYFDKSPQQLFKEFEALTSDTQRWEWVKANQGGGFALHLDNDAPCVTFEDIEEYLEFDECIRWSAGTVTLLDAMGIKREML